MVQGQSTVLLVDDDADTRTSLSILLRADGYRVLRADGGSRSTAV